MVITLAFRSTSSVIQGLSLYYFLLLSFSDNFWHQHLHHLLKCSGLSLGHYSFQPLHPFPCPLLCPCQLCTLAWMEPLSSEHWDRGGGEGVSSNTEEHLYDPQYSPLEPQPSMACLSIHALRWRKSQHIQTPAFGDCEGACLETHIGSFIASISFS